MKVAIGLLGTITFFSSALVAAVASEKVLVAPENVVAGAYQWFGPECMCSDTTLKGCYSAFPSAPCNSSTLGNSATTCNDQTTVEDCLPLNNVEVACGFDTTIRHDCIGISIWSCSQDTAGTYYWRDASATGDSELPCQKSLFKCTFMSTS